MEVTYALGEQMLMLAGAAKTQADARRQLERSISGGAALTKFRELVARQGGDAAVVDEPSRMPRAKLRAPIAAAHSGFVREVDAMGAALAALRLGAGRSKTEDAIDHAVGISELVKIGERVEAGAPLAVIHANSDTSLAAAKTMLRDAIKISDTPIAAPSLIDRVIG
jgi:thymidine phosphorylase